MFDLNEHIMKWRSSLAQSQMLDRADIEELESHLQEEIENLVRLNLSGEEAFLVATHRLGSADSLAHEYERINHARKFKHRLPWIVTGVLACYLAYYLAGIVAVAVAVGSGSRDFNPGIVIVVLRILFWSTVVFLCYHVYKGNLCYSRLRPMLHNLKSKCIFFTSLVIAAITLVSIILLIAAEIFSDFLMIRMIIDSLDLEGMALVWECVRLVWSIMLPAILVMLLTKMNMSELPQT